MAQNITRSVEDLVAAARRGVRAVTIAEAMSLYARDDVLFVDVRDVRELAKTGRIPGARHVPRGLLEFWIDPKSPYHKPFFAEDRTFVFYCALDWRAVLAARSAQDMGLAPVAHLEGGFAAWEEAGGPVEASTRK